MSDTWQYRIRVSGSDKDRWYEMATSRRWGRGLVSWPMSWRSRVSAAHRVPAACTWYNLITSNDAECAEFIGNFGGTPRLFFEKKERGLDALVEPEADFSALNIHVEVVGHSWLCGSEPEGVYSYREVYEGGGCVLEEKSNDELTAQKYAPELLVRFPREEL